MVKYLCEYRSRVNRSAGGCEFLIIDVTEPEVVQNECSSKIFSVWS